jgi:hypothetical protein
MDLLDNDEALLIKNESPPLTSMDINMVFTLLTELRGAEEEVAQMCLSPKEAVFEKPKESSQRCRQSDVVLRLQEAWKEGRRAREDQPEA